MDPVAYIEGVSLTSSVLGVLQRPVRPKGAVGARQPLIDDAVGKTYTADGPKWERWSRNTR